MTICDMWVTFERAVLDPIGAGPVQREETRRGFYAGAAAMFAIMHEVSGDSVSEEAGVVVLKRVSAELAEYARSVGSGAP